MLTCPIGNEAVYAKKYQELLNSKELEEIVYFQYERMMRYGGKWHLENRAILPGYIFLYGASIKALMQIRRENGGRKQDVSFLFEAFTDESLIPCETPYLKDMCQEGNLVGMSKGVIQDGNLIVTSGPLEGREQLIQKINRHKRTAEIEIPFAGAKKHVTVGLEIYKKDIGRSE